jgi:3',5'-cyclic AMP phosphodiesterase CpdA
VSVATGRLTILHLSDIHATEDAPLYGRVDAEDRLAAVERVVKDSGATVDAIVVTGDIVERGNGRAYPRVGRALNRLAEGIGAPLLSVLGNHDDAAAAPCQLAGSTPRGYGAVQAGPLRVILLDSSTGRLGKRQLGWLNDTLARQRIGYSRRWEPTVVALHHPPIDSPLPALRGARLADADAFAAAIDGMGVNAILAGHYHHPLAASLRGVPVFVGPALSYQQRASADPVTTSAIDAPMVSVVHLTRAGVTAMPLSVAESRTLFEDRPLATSSAR